MPNTSLPSIGKYQLLEQIGEGGFGVVYRARDAQLEREVALKLLHAHLASAPDFVERFRREAKMAAALHHPNIVTMIDVGEQAGRYFLVMEYIPGPSLSALLKEKGALPLSQALAILRPLAQALDYAHAQGIIHRDVKPANILLAEGGKRPVLTDFGLVKSTTEDTSTTTGILLGTVEYMAPEQITGQPPTPAVDLYALGVIAYQMLSGRVPFAGKTPFDIQNGHVNLPPPDPCQLNPDLDERLAQILLRALAKAPSERYPDAASLVQAFEAYLHQEEEQTLVRQYEEAAALAEAEQWAEAILLWESIQRARPGYRDVHALLEAARPRLRLQAELEKLLAEYRHWKAAAEAWLESARQQGLRTLEPLQALLQPKEAVREVIQDTPPQVIMERKRPGWVIPALVACLVLGGLIGFAIRGPSWVEVVRTVVVTQIVVEYGDVTVPTDLSPDRYPGMALIPADSFLMGSDTGPADEQPVHEVSLDAFYMDAYEVTSERYAQCVAAGACSASDCSSEANHPVLCADWNQAQAYCAWIGGRLPTEAEWEFAARGGLEGKLYPWGDDSPVCQAGATNGGNFADCGNGDAIAVGSYAPNGYGLYDMAGNVWEWTSSLYQPYPYNAQDGREDLSASGSRVLRGGGWSYFANALRVAYRSSFDPAGRNDVIGFRCAFSP
jgi:formylglycine-generating enzyme required for sulfatase activity/predicted Ser/Thr protein kinase